MNFHLGRVLDFAHTKPEEVQIALEDFFKENQPDKKSEEDAFPLFMEWLIFDYHQTSGPTFIAEYSLKNPDQLSAEEIDKYVQIAKTHQFSIFEIQKIKRGKWIDIENLFTGEIIRVYDHLGSQNSPDKGTLYARVAKVDSKFYFVGSNSHFAPITYTERMKKVFREDFKDKKFSPKDTWVLLANHGKITDRPPLNITREEIEEKRKMLKENFETLSKKYATTISFAELTKYIYEENKETAVLDFWQELCKKGLDEKMFFDHPQLFSDVWNYFPHCALNNKSPVEIYNEAYGKRGKG